MASAVVGPPGDQPPPLLLPARRPHEHEQRLGERRLHGQRALHVDLEHHVVARVELRRRRTAGACPSGRRRPRTTRGSHRRRGSARTPRGSRSGSRRPRLRRDEAGGVVHDTDQPQARILRPQCLRRSCPCRHPTYRRARAGRPPAIALRRQRQSANFSSSARRWFVAQTAQAAALADVELRHDVARARTLPTPGSDSSTLTTFSFASMSPDSSSCRPPRTARAR